MRTYRKIVAAAFALISAGILCLGLFTWNVHRDTTGCLPHPMPWQSIGGCGAGGSVTGGTSAMWIGRGISGRIIDLEVRTTQSVIHATGGGTVLLKTSAIPVQLALHHRFADLYGYLPIVYKQKLSEDGSSNRLDQAAGIGDFSLNVQKRLGMEGTHALILGMTLPTGKADIHGLQHTLLPSDVQNGNGMFGLNLTYDHTTTHDWGVFIFGATYSPGLFYLQTATERWDDDLGRLVAEKHRFTGARASPASSRNDMGVISPDYFSFHAYGGIKHPRLTHSFGLNGSIPLGKAFYTEYDYVITPKNNALISSFPTGGTPLLEDYGFQLPDDTLSYHFTQSDSVWVVREEIRKKEDRWFTLTPIYGLEIYNDFLPLFLALSLPVEFNGKTGVGVKGFTLELGMKLGVY